MEFYSEISQAYDQIFPFNADKFSFLSEDLSASGSVLDVACATGGYSKNFFEKGFSVTGIDLDSPMIELAKMRYAGISFLAMNMLDIDTIEGDFNCIFCIGNSLVHLPDIESVELFLQKAFHKLSELGFLKLQIINYDRIVHNRITSLPTIKGKNFTFTRNYRLVKNDRYVEFNTILTQGKKVMKNSVRLLTLRKLELTNLLKKAGFTAINHFGSFQSTQFIDDSIPLIITAQKPRK
jgi:glycine/sarcosine N-methyltransferase